MSVPMLESASKWHTSWCGDRTKRSICFAAVVVEGANKGITFNAEVVVPIGISPRHVDYVAGRRSFCRESVARFS